MLSFWDVFASDRGRLPGLRFNSVSRQSRRGNMNKYLQNSILGSIQADVIEIGKGVVVEEGVVIKGKNGPAEYVRLGDFSFIGRETVIITPHFEIGDYSKFHANGFGHGELPLRIGRNCWIGGNVVLDSMGGLDIDDNVGIGASSQIWTHIMFGDIIEGCRFNSRRYMHIGRDAWFVGHCIVSPVVVEERSMAMAGSVITRDMESNHIYAGVPAVDITSKIGPQFVNRSADEKQSHLTSVISEFVESNPEFADTLYACTEYPEQLNESVTYFNVSDRTYTQRFSAAEIAFMRKHVPTIKFVPRYSINRIQVPLAYQNLKQ